MIRRWTQAAVSPARVRRRLRAKDIHPERPFPECKYLGQQSVFLLFVVIYRSRTVFSVRSIQGAEERALNLARSRCKASRAVDSKYKRKSAPPLQVEGPAGDFYAGSTVQSVTVEACSQKFRVEHLKIHGFRIVHRTINLGNNLVTLHNKRLSANPPFNPPRLSCRRAQR